MRRHLLAAAVIPFLLAGCGRDTPEAVADEMNSILRDMAAAVDSVKDDATAKAAATKIDALASRLTALGARADKVRTDAKGKAAFEAKLKEGEKDAMGVATKMMSLSATNPSAAKIVGEAMARFGKAAEALEK